ncbi:MAG TPA: BTAD domain-containing putative transcriptional regulator [Streptosporangiales bacterium]
MREDTISWACVQVRMLGCFSVTAATRPVSLSTAGARLVAFLGLHGPGARSYVAGTLWPDVSEARAHANLRTTLWRASLRAPGLVSCDADVVRLAPSVDTDTDDLAAVAHLLLSGHLPARPPLPLLASGGMLLPGWYDDWVFAARERIRLLHQEALECLAGIHLTRRQYGRALEPALLAAQQEPLRETAHRLLLQIHMGCGNVVEAQRVFETYRLRLDTELGLRPSAAMCELVELSGMAWSS